jgi:hypothetical protein
MPRARDALSLVRLRFAAGNSLIESLFHSDGSFSMLCRDYRDCVETLERLQHDDTAVGLARQAEYTELREELEKEIRDWLERHKTNPTP